MWLETRQHKRSFQMIDPSWGQWALNDNVSLQDLTRFLIPINQGECEHQKCNVVFCNNKQQEQQIICVCVCVFVCIHACACGSKFLCMNVDLHICAYINVFVDICICIMPCRCYVCVEYVSYYAKRNKYLYINLYYKEPIFGYVFL